MGNGVCTQRIYQYLHNQCQILCTVSAFSERNLRERNPGWDDGGIVLVMDVALTGKHKAPGLYSIFSTVDYALFSPPL